jgi:hypothetical protein
MRGLLTLTSPAAEQVTPLSYENAAEVSGRAPLRTDHAIIASMSACREQEIL